MITEAIHRLVEWQNAKANRAWHLYSYEGNAVLRLELREGPKAVRATITMDAFVSQINDPLALAFKDAEQRIRV